MSVCGFLTPYPFWKRENTHCISNCSRNSLFPRARLGLRCHGHSLSCHGHSHVEGSEHESIVTSLNNVSYRIGNTLLLDDVDMEIRDGEIIALMGPSGCGKSTILRLLSGLLSPSSGSVSHRNRVLSPGEINPAVSMVFQNFALLPWLTVLDNVVLGAASRGPDGDLSARTLAPTSTYDRAQTILHSLGLDGYEDALPKELSGGQRQRVGMARALAAERDLLCLDEPFSSLDIFTAQSLRHVLSQLWMGVGIGQVARRPRAMCLVTHNIEEAVDLADRILILSRHTHASEKARDRQRGRVEGSLSGLQPRDRGPQSDQESGSRISGELLVQLPHPRARSNPQYQDLVDAVYCNLGEASVSTSSPRTRATNVVLPAVGDERLLPAASVAEVLGFLESLPENDWVPLHDLLEDTRFEVDDWMPVVETSSLLGFCVLRNGSVRLTPAGTEFIGPTSRDGGRTIAKSQLLDRVPLMAFIYRSLHFEEKPIHTSRFVKGISPLHRQQRAQVRLLVEWGRFAELFRYDDRTGLLRPCVSPTHPSVAAQAPPTAHATLEYIAPPAPSSSSPPPSSSS
eukprot:Rmarinus@m.15343